MSLLKRTIGVVVFILIFALISCVSNRNDNNGAQKYRAKEKNTIGKLSRFEENSIGNSKMKRNDCISKISLKRELWDAHLPKRINGPALQLTLELLGKNERFRKHIKKYGIQDFHKVYFNVLTIDRQKKEKDLFRDGEISLDIDLYDKEFSFETWTRNPQYLTNIDNSKSYSCLNMDLRYIGEINDKEVIILYWDTNKRYSLNKVDGEWTKTSIAGHGADKVFAIVLQKNKHRGYWTGKIIERNPKIEKRGISKEDICHSFVEDNQIIRNEVRPKR